MFTTISNLFLLLLPIIQVTPTAATFATRAPFHGEKYADISEPRGLLLDDQGDILCVSRTPSTIVVLYETPEVNGVKQQLIVNGKGLDLNHGIAYLAPFLYASSTSTVYRWPYTPGQRREITTQAEIVVHSIPPGGSHVTRTLIFDSQSRLYVSVGALQNVDPDSSRSRIRRFDDLTQVPFGGYNFSDGTIFADGLRNEAALDFDGDGKLHGLENGVGSPFNRPDLGDILGGNPSEEWNKFDGDDLGHHYGYPYCFSSYDLQNYPIGTQFAMPNFWTDGLHTDEWCRNAQNNRPPIFHLPQHSAPLGLHFYRGQGCDGVNGSFPCSFKGNAVAAMHGSNYVKLGAVEGYSVALFVMKEGVPTGERVDLIFEPSITNCDKTCFRPVNAIFNSNGHLIISCDKTNEIYKVTYNP